MVLTPQRPLGELCIKLRQECQELYDLSRSKMRDIPCNLRRLLQKTKRMHFVQLSEAAGDGAELGLSERLATGLSPHYFEIIG